MEKQDIIEMQKQEQNYWWHISRRFILKSILEKFLFCCSNLSPSFWGAKRLQNLSLCHSREGGNPEKNKNIYKIKGMDPRVPFDKLRAGKPEDDKGKNRNDNELKILDVGCGTGANLKWLKEVGSVIGIDSSQEAVKFCQKYGNAKWGTADHLPFKNDSCDLITAFDILEHISDDRAALKEWYRVLKIGGYLYITVPAYQWLFSPHDKQLQHYRRYLVSNLSKKLQKAGFKPIFASYFFMFTFPVFIIQRIASKVFNTAPGYTKVSSGIDNFLIGLGKIEARLLKFISLPFGSSIVVLVKKND